MARTSVAAVLLLAWSWWTFHQIIITIMLLVPTIRWTSAQNIRDQFTRTFYDRCYNKYEFIQDYIDIVDSKPEQYLEFVYNEDGLVNGGIGDRSAGLISAFLHAIRFRRSLNLYADNNMHKLFRPFHPRFIPDPRTVKETEKISPEEDYFLWENWGNWSGYESFKQRSGKDLPGFGLTCHFTIIPREPYDNMCGLVDVPEENIDAIPFIRMTSNRCYICRFFNRDDLPNHESVMRALKIPEESKEEANLFEIGGCIMRLLMWPRESLWTLVDQFYSSRLKEEEPSLGVSSDATTMVRSQLSVPFTLRETPPFQMALQYRCGDEPSFQFVAQQSACFDFDNLELEAGLELPRSNFFLAGRPLELGRCLLALADYLRQLRDQDSRGNSPFHPISPHPPDNYLY